MYMCVCTHACTCAYMVYEYLCYIIVPDEVDLLITILNTSTARLSWNPPNDNSTEYLITLHIYQGQEIFITTVSTTIITIPGLGQ